MPKHLVNAAVGLFLCLWGMGAAFGGGMTLLGVGGPPAGGGSPTNIFTQSLSTSSAGNAGFSIAQEVTLSGNSQGHINVTLTGAAGGFTATNIYICVSTGTSPSCTAAPTQVLFSGSATATVPANSSVTSDWTAFSTTGTDFVVCYEITVDGAEAYQTTGLTGQTAWARFQSGVCSAQSRATFTNTSFGATSNLGLTNIQTEP